MQSGDFAFIIILALAVIAAFLWNYLSKKKAPKENANKTPDSCDGHCEGCTGCGEYKPYDKYEDFNGYMK